MSPSRKSGSIVCESYLLHGRKEKADDIFEISKEHFDSELVGNQNFHGQNFLLSKKLMEMTKMKQLLLQHAIGEIAGSYKIEAQSGRNPNCHSKALPHVVRITGPGSKVEAIFQMTSVLRSNAMGFATLWKPLQ
jgi:hypothetical protein